MSCELSELSELSELCASLSQAAAAYARLGEVSDWEADGCAPGRAASGATGGGVVSTPGLEVHGRPTACYIDIPSQEDWGGGSNSRVFGDSCAFGSGGLDRVRGEGKGVGGREAQILQMFLDPARSYQTCLLLPDPACSYQILPAPTRSCLLLPDPTCSYLLLPALLDPACFYQILPARRPAGGRPTWRCPPHRLCRPLACSRRRRRSSYQIRTSTSRCPP